MRIDVLTIFPEMFAPVLETSIPGRARAAGAATYHTTDLRDFAGNKHNKIDDRPFGGGPGMVMTCQPIWDAVHAIEAHDAHLPAQRILMTPQGTPLTQHMVEQLAALPRLLIIAGHYEGVDERVVERLAPMEISVGDYVLSGGELAALVLIDAVVRLLPGVLGDDQSAAQDSFSPAQGDGRRLLDCPHYTRPRDWQGAVVPDVLISGDHGAVARWRLERQRERTLARRPDLMAPAPPASPHRPQPPAAPPGGDKRAGLG
jgi:tRNA (guanine37-N1)-methyltransferase